MSRRRRGLTPAEQELWASIARSANPLHLPDPVGKSQQPSAETPPSRPKAAKPPGGGAKPQRTVAPTADNPLQMDHKTHKRMIQGKIRPEARLDLHGMTLAIAQPELVRFILSCHENGLRMVLVITGKGRGEHGPLPVRQGALRHIVPQWLSQQPCIAAVQQVTQAHFHHGGEGAYYVYLRRLPGQAL